MLMSLPANPVPAELYRFIAGATDGIWLPWYVWGGGTYATKYGYDPTKFVGYLGTVSVPLIGQNVAINSLRLQATVDGQIGATEGAVVTATLYEQSGIMASPIASIVVDRRTVPNSSIGSPFVDITQGTGGFVASASQNALAIELVGGGQGIATIAALIIDYSY